MMKIILVSAAIFAASTAVASASAPAYVPAPVVSTAPVGVEVARPRTIREAIDYIREKAAEARCRLANRCG